MFFICACVFLYVLSGSSDPGVRGLIEKGESVWIVLSYAFYLNVRFSKLYKLIVQVNNICCASHSADKMNLRKSILFDCCYYLLLINIIFSKLQV